MFEVDVTNVMKVREGKEDQLRFGALIPNSIRSKAWPTIYEVSKKVNSKSNYFVGSH